MHQGNEKIAKESGIPGDNGCECANCSAKRELMLVMADALVAIKGGGIKELFAEMEKEMGPAPFPRVEAVVDDTPQVIGSGAPIEGDACECETCVVRRATFGPDPTVDARLGRSEYQPERLLVRDDLPGGGTVEVYAVTPKQALETLRQIKGDLNRGGIGLAGIGSLLDQVNERLAGLTLMEPASEMELVADGYRRIEALMAPAERGRYVALEEVKKLVLRMLLEGADDGV